jgi:hypothetical protein
MSICLSCVDKVHECNDLRSSNEPCLEVMPCEVNEDNGVAMVDDRFT